MVKQKTNMLTKKSKMISKECMCLTCQSCLSLRKKRASVLLKTSKPKKEDEPNKQVAKTTIIF